jgi:ribosomal protein L11 methyltransferase
MPPDRWLSITVTLPSESPGAGGLELLPSTLVELGGRGVEEEEGAFTTYLPPPADLEGFLRLVRSRLDELALSGAELRWGWRAHDDWEILWRRGLGPRCVTDRLIIAPSWEVPDVEEGRILIVLDPGMAFGTAEHATTRGCLRLLDSRVREGDRIADVGSGSGILAIAAARLGAREVLAVEGDPLACDVARENLMANEVQGKVRVVQEEYRGREPLPGERYQGIVANIQSSVILPLLPAFRDSLVEGGWVILGGILEEERRSVLSVTAGHGLDLEEEDPEGEWWTGAFRLSKARA